MWSIDLVMLDGYVIAIGGACHSIERFDPTNNNWQLMDSSRMPHEVDHLPVAAALDGLIYVLGMEQVNAPAGSTFWFS